MRGGHAKDFGLKENRHWKGGYAALRIIPGVPLWQELVASNDAMTWMVDREDSAVEKSGYRKLYPAYGTYVGGEAGNVVALFTPWVWLIYAVQLGMVALGHIIGQTAALFVDERPAPDPVWFTGEFAPPDECPPRFPRSVERAVDVDRQVPEQIRVRPVLVVVPAENLGVGHRERDLW
jgi:hypothetical protein